MVSSCCVYTAVCHTRASPCVLVTQITSDSFTPSLGHSLKKKMHAYNLEVQPYCFLCLFLLSSFLCFLYLFLLFFFVLSPLFIPSSLLPPSFQFQFPSDPLLVASCPSCSCRLGDGWPASDRPVRVAAGVRPGGAGCVLFSTWFIDWYRITHTKSDDLLPLIFNSRGQVLEMEHGPEILKIEKIHEECLVWVS